MCRKILKIVCALQALKKLISIFLTCWMMIVSLFYWNVLTRQVTQVYILTSNLPLQYAKGGTALEDNSKLWKISQDISQLNSQFSSKIYQYFSSSKYLKRSNFSSSLSYHWSIASVWCLRAPRNHAWSLNPWPIS